MKKVKLISIIFAALLLCTAAFAQVNNANQIDNPGVNVGGVTTGGSGMVTTGGNDNYPTGAVNRVPDNDKALVEVGLDPVVPIGCPSGEVLITEAGSP
ncbi:MAG: hypothetical protein LBR90_03720, partial [Elusimicrobiota bacterium]|nr:hypothetical protein [Elusimicrobiota bacterium]